MRAAKLLITASLMLLGGCTAMTLGPTISERTTFVKCTDELGRPVKIGVIRDQVKATVQYETQGGQQGTAVLDIGGWAVVPPAENKPK